MAEHHEAVCDALLSLASPLHGAQASPELSIQQDIDAVSSILRRHLPEDLQVSPDAQVTVASMVSEFVKFLIQQSVVSLAPNDQVLSQSHLLESLNEKAIQSFSRKLISKFSMLESPSIRMKSLDLNANRSGRSSSCGSYRLLPVETPKSRKKARSSKKTPIAAPQLLNIHEMRDLNEVSLEVAAAIVYAASNPLLKTALYIAGSPSPMTSSSKNSESSSTFLSPVHLPAATPMESLGKERYMQDHPQGHLDGNEMLMSLRNLASYAHGQTEVTSSAATL